jgi:hypothetical protein
MSKYTKKLTAKQLIEYIACDYVELSYDKVLWQRNDHMNICREWLDYQQILAGADINSGDGGYEEGTWGKHNEFLKKRNGE